MLGDLLGHPPNPLHFWGPESPNTRSTRMLRKALATSSISPVLDRWIYVIQVKIQWIEYDMRHFEMYHGRESHKMRDFTINLRTHIPNGDGFKPGIQAMHRLYITIHQIEWRTRRTCHFWHGVIYHLLMDIKGWLSSIKHQRVVQF